MKEKTRAPARNRGKGFLDRFESTSPWWRALVLAAILAVVLSALMGELVFHNDIFHVPDSQAPLSFASVGEKALAEGAYPLWNPYIFCGMPSYGSLSFTPYVYPFSYVLYLLARYLHFPEMTWLLFHYFLAGIGAYLLARSLGARWTVAVLAGITFMLMPNLVANGAHGHGSQVSSVAYMPYALLLSWQVCRGQRRLLSASLLAIVLGFQMLRGHVQIAYYTYLLIALLFVFESASLLRARRARAVATNLAFIGAALVVAMGIAAVLLIPVKEYSAYSIRGGGSSGGLTYDYATGWSLHPKEMLTFVFPWAFGFGTPTYWGEMPFTNYPNYLGVVTAAFALFALFFAKDRAKWFFAAVVILATLVSFGKYFPVLHGPMFKLLPYFNKFRVPVMVLIAQQLAAVMLMAMGIEEFLKRRDEGGLPSWLESRRMKWILVGSIALVLLVLIASGGIKDGIAGSPAVRAKVRGSDLDLASAAFAANLLKTLVLVAAVCLTAFLAVSRRLVGHTVVLVLAAVAIVDVFPEDRGILHPEKVWPTSGRIIMDKSVRDEIRKPDEVTNFLAADTAYFRLLPIPAEKLGSWGVSSRLFSENRFMIFGISSLGGYHAAKLRSYQSVLDVMFASFNRGQYPAAVINMLNAKYILSLYPLFHEDSPFPLVLQTGNAYLYENPAALPRAFCVDSFRVCSMSEALALLNAPDFDPSREVLLNEAPSIRPQSAAGARVRITKLDVNEIAITAYAEKPCILVLSEIAYPDWKAEIDGTATKILTANYCLRALPLESGDHEIRLHISSGVLRMSLLISVASFAMALIVAAVRGFAAARGR